MQNPVPLSYLQAQRGYHGNAEQRHQARRDYVSALKSRAEKRREHRKQRAQAYARFREDKKAQEESKILADAEVADIEFEAEMADAEAKGLAALLEQLKDDRATIRHLSDWGREES